MLRDLNTIPRIYRDGDAVFKKAKKAITGKSEEKKERYKKEEVMKAKNKGFSEVVATAIVEARVENKTLLSEDTIILSDNTETLVSGILNNPNFYKGKYLFDPIEPEKGGSKAIINVVKGIPSIYSFLHGGINYQLKNSRESILKIAENSYAGDANTNQETVMKITKLIDNSVLSAPEEKKVAHILKKKKIVSSIDEIRRTRSSDIIGFKDTKDDFPLPTKGNLITLLNHYGIEVSYDEILKEQKIIFENEHLDTDNQLNSNIAKIKNKCILSGLSKGVVKDFLHSIIDENSFNPMMYMIASKTWDKVDRVSLIINCISSNDNPIYVREVITRWLIQCVAAWDHAKNSPYPNVLPRFENVLTFVGAQGIQKTKFFEQLLPRSHKEYIGTGIHLNLKDKDSIHLAIGKAITELGELDSTFKGEIAMLKAFLSLPIDKYRRPYAPAESTFKRRTSFCASVNDDEFLVDPTGNRRFHPIKVEKFEYDAYMEIDKQQLWAQVFENFYLKGEHWWIDMHHNPEVCEMLEKKHINHSIMNPADEVAIAVIENTKTALASHLVWKSSTEIALAKGLQAKGRKDISIIKKRLTEAGIEFNSRTKKFKVSLEHEKKSESREKTKNPYH